MSNLDLVEILRKQIVLYYQIFKERDLNTSVFVQKQKERERKRRYYDEVDRFLGLRAQSRLEN